MCDWEALYSENHADIAYNEFLKIFSKAYDSIFSDIQVNVKTKTILSQWIVKGIKKSSKNKQKLYKKFLKERAYNSERRYKNNKNLYEKIKSSPKKLYYKNQLLKYVNNLKGTWSVIKEVIGKKK